MSLRVIKQLSDEQAERARAEQVQPFIAQRDKDPDVTRCPNFGTYVPDGWELKEEFFVDKSGGWSSAAELALHGCLSVEQMIDRVKKDRGYAIVEEGEFQLYIGEFVPVGDDWDQAGEPVTLEEFEQEQK